MSRTLSSKALYIDTDVYIHPPQGFPQGEFFKLNKALYGLKQSPRLFQQTLSGVFLELGFVPTISDTCIYVHPTSKIRILTVVDDCIIEGNDEHMRTAVETVLADRFKIKAFSSVEIFIGIQLEHTKTHVKLHQASFVETLLERFNMEGCKIANTPAPLPNLNKVLVPCYLRKMAIVNWLAPLST